MLPAIKWLEQSDELADSGITQPAQIPITFAVAYKLAEYLHHVAVQELLDLLAKREHAGVEAVYAAIPLELYAQLTLDQCTCVGERLNEQDDRVPVDGAGCCINCGGPNYGQGIRHDDTCSYYLEEG